MKQSTCFSLLTYHSDRVSSFPILPPSFLPSLIPPTPSSFPLCLTPPSLPPFLHSFLPPSPPPPFLFDQGPFFVHCLRSCSQQYLEIMLYLGSNLVLPCSFCFCFGPCRGYSWFYTMEFPLVVLCGPYRMWGIESRSATCKSQAVANSTLCAIAPVLPHVLDHIFNFGSQVVIGCAWLC